MMRDVPHALLPRGLSRDVAAEYVGVGTTLFDKMVMDGRMPVDGRRVWDPHKIDRFFEDIPGGDDENNPWDGKLKKRRTYQ